MSVSDPGEKIEWGADSELRKNERVPSSGKYTQIFAAKIKAKLIAKITRQN
jgi:hypothetical protein